MKQRSAFNPSEGLRRAPPIVRTHPIGCDLELRVRAVIDPASVGDSPVVDVRMYHRSGREWLPGHQGFEVPVRLAGAVSEAIRVVAARAVQLVAMAPPRSRP